MAPQVGEDTKNAFHELLKSLRRDRERLAVRLNLGKKEVKDEWTMVEQKWEILERHLAEFTEDASDSAHRIGKEIEQAYHRLRDKVR